MKRFLFEYLPGWLLLMVFGFIVLHAPITVWLGTQFPSVALAVKAWKEVMIVLAAVLLLLALWRAGKLRMLAEPMVLLPLIYIALHVFMIGLYPQSAAATVAGLMIDVRYVLYFVDLVVFLQLYPPYAPSFLRVGITGAFIVMLTTVIQLFLPHNALSVLGYGPDTIQPYLTVDKNPDFIRYNSTLRGPNPLGAFAVIVLSSVLAYWAMMRKKLSKKQWIYVAILGGASLVSLWVSYSRSALIAAAVAAVLVLVIALKPRLTPRKAGVAVAIILLFAAAGYAARNTSFVANVIMHNNPTTGAEVDSNAGHVESLADGVRRMATQPLGAGIGSTGSASVIGGKGLIIENQYLMIAHEVGWGGLALFIGLSIYLLRQLKRQSGWLATAVFASGIGMAIIGLLLPVWVDDTVSIVWWGLAALVIAGGVYGQHASNQKTKRAA